MWLLICQATVPWQTQRLPLLLHAVDLGHPGHLVGHHADTALGTVGGVMQLSGAQYILGKVRHIQPFNISVVSNFLLLDASGISDDPAPLIGQIVMTTEKISSDN